jgi:glycosyltransferase involved in cell wall biosynthesis
MERTLLAHCPSLRGRVECILGGVDVKRFRPRDGGQGAVVGFIGRLSPEKGADRFLEIATAVLREEPAARFVVVGDGPLREEAEAAAARCGEGKITLLGERYDVEATVATFDILAVPSDIEAFGLVSLEAMASGRPVVAFDVGGIPEIVVHGETGLLVTHADTKAFASALLRLLRQPEVRHRMGRAGRARAETLFDVRRTVRSLETLYEAAVRS